MVSGKTQGAQVGKQASKKMPQRDMGAESMGWVAMIVIMFAFPALFYLCVYFPIWVGWTPRW